VLLRSLEAGGSVVLSRFGRDTVSDLERFTPTVASIVPTMAYRLLESAPDSLAAVGIVLTGGARLTHRLFATASARGVSLVPTYGMTEAGSQIATAVPGSPPPDGDLVGPPLEGFTVSIHTDAGPAGIGDVGVIEVEGPAVFDGYLGEEPRTGAHRTSDLGYIDAAGSVGVIGRVDDVVITGGENVSLSSVAAAIDDVDGVRDVVVVAIPDHEWGAVICALVDIEPDMTIASIRDQLVTHFAHHGVPKRMEAGSVPLLPNGKHDVVAVQRRFGAQ
jgi:O-succinylbenzoic acid--CoA ligase